MSLAFYNYLKVLELKSLIMCYAIAITCIHCKIFALKYVLFLLLQMQFQYVRATGSDLKETNVSSISLEHVFKYVIAIL